MRYFIIAELGINHVGDMDLAREMIDAAEEAGADAVKFQYYKWEDIADEFRDIATLPNSTVQNPLIEQVKKSQLALEQLALLRDHARSKGLGWICTPFKRASRIAELATLKPDAIKIRYRDFSPSAVELALKQDVPLVLASCPAPPIENMALYYQPRARWLYCIPKYPPSLGDFDLARSSGFHGFSDHFPHNSASLLAAAATKRDDYIIEKHVMLSPSGVDHVVGFDARHVPDAHVSITFKKLAELVGYLRDFEKLRPTAPFFPSRPR